MMHLMRDGVREWLAGSDLVTGVIVFTGGTVIVELAAAAALDLVILDREHSALDLTGDAHLIRAADGSGIPAYMRA